MPNPWVRMIHKLFLLGAERNGVIRLVCRRARVKCVAAQYIKSIHVCIWAIIFEIRIILNARGHTGFDVVVYSCTTIWVVVWVGREACSAGAIAPGRESRRVVRFLERYGTVRAKVNTTLGDTAVCAIVDAHRHVEAVSERNLVIIGLIGTLTQYKLSSGNWRLS